MTAGRMFVALGAVAFQALALGGVASLAACDGTIVDLGHDLDAGADVLSTADPRFACAFGSAARGPLLTMEDVDRTLQRRWISCNARGAFQADNGFEFVDDGTRFSLRRPSPSGPWVRDLATPPVGYDVTGAPGADEGRWAFQIILDLDASIPTPPTYGYFTVWPLRLVLSDGDFYAPLPTGVAQ